MLLGNNNNNLKTLLKMVILYVKFQSEKVITFISIFVA